MSSFRPYDPWANGDPFGVADRLSDGAGFRLQQWPIKLWKISETAPFFHNAHLLIAADCVGFTYTPLHERYTPGRIPLICCPETDFDIVSKLAYIITINDIRSISVIRMDSPCCEQLTSMVMQAIKLSRKPLPLQSTTVFIDAEEVE